MEFTFTFTEAEANLMISALQELPFKVSHALIGKVMQQAQAQQPTPAMPIE